MKTIAQGAEAIIKLDKNIILKERIVKGYRYPVLDEKIRKSRTKREAKLLTKAGEIVDIPKVLGQDKFNIEMEFIDGDKLSETLSSYEEAKQFQVMKQLGEQVAKLHSENIIHGDLTTSNVILVEGSSGSACLEERSCKCPPKTATSCRSHPLRLSLNKKGKCFSEGFRIFIIDFGLGFVSARIEDKAVDLHLIKQALEAKHFQNWEKLFESFLSGYKFEEAGQVLEQLKKVEGRGRYKH